MPSQVLSVNILREDTIRKKYPASYEDCGTNDDEQCPKGYPGAQKGSEEYKKVMKFTSAVKMFGKSALKKIRESRDKKAEVASGGQEKSKNAQWNSARKFQRCPAGYYAEAAAIKPARIPDITLGLPDTSIKTKIKCAKKILCDGKKLARYNCKGTQHVQPCRPLPSPLDYCGCNPCQSALRAVQMSTARVARISRQQKASRRESVCRARSAQRLR